MKFLRKIKFISAILDKIEYGIIEKRPEEQRSFWRCVIYTLPFILFWVGFYKSDSIYHLILADIQIKKQKKEILRYQRELKQMDSRINMLSNDKDTLEQFAREYFNFCANGEDVYVIKND